MRLTLRAAADIYAIAAYVQDRHPAGARKVEAALQEAFRLIAAYPYVGQIRRQGVRRFAVPRHPYLIFYGVDAAAQQINVLTVRHAAREDVT
nr:type II toxin-antitoxin system RelE/ParE family toxin [Methylobacterium sp. 37f]